MSTDFMNAEPVGKGLESLDTFWHEIDEQFIHIEAAFTDYPVETKEQAQSGELRQRRLGSFDGVNAPVFKRGAGEFIRYRESAPEWDWRDDYYEQGKALIEPLRQQIEARQITPKLILDLTMANYYRGYIESFITDSSDTLAHVRAGSKAQRATQKKWLAHVLLHFMKKEKLSRVKAEDKAVALIGNIISAGDFPKDFSKEWYEKMLSGKMLKTTYLQKNFSIPHMRRLVAEGDDKIPPLPF